MFQMKFYAVALLRSRGVLPTRLRLIYLADGQLLDYSPDLDELVRFEKTLIAIWRAIQSAGATGDFRPSPSRLCDWCAHHAHCPVFGGTPPEYPGWPEASAGGLRRDDPERGTSDGEERRHEGLRRDDPERGTSDGEEWRHEGLRRDDDAVARHPGTAA